MSKTPLIIHTLFLLASFLMIRPSFAAFDCGLLLLRAINRISNPKRTEKIIVDSPILIRRLHQDEKLLLKPELVGISHEALPISVNFKNFSDFKNIVGKLERKGLWLITMPTSPNEMNFTVGHSWVWVGDSIFDRSVTDIRSGEAAINGLEGAANSVPYLVAQFFELSDASVSILNRFFHDRAWFHYWQGGQPHPEFFSQYVTQPLSKDAEIPYGENCLTFTCPWNSIRWKDYQPDLVRVQQEMGSMTFSEVPIKQMYNNVASPAYRGTVIITNDPTMKQSLKTDGMNRDPFGQQLLLEGPMIEAKEEK